MGDYVCEVIRCNEPLVSWQMEQPILLLINYVNVTDIMSLGQMLLALIIYCYHYRKPTHTDLYLHWDSHHDLYAKLSVINTLKHRAKTVCSSYYLLKEEEDHLNKALRRCKYPVWALNRVNIKQNRNRIK